jgi:hypothetical protein
MKCWSRFGLPWTRSRHGLHVHSLIPLASSVTRPTARASFEFPLELDMSPYVTERRQEDACAAGSADNDGSVDEVCDKGRTARISKTTDEGISGDDDSAADEGISHEPSSVSAGESDVGEAELRGDAPTAEETSATCDDASSAAAAAAAAAQREAAKAAGNLYELFSIMIHSGSALGGHYYAFIKDLDSGKWFTFNDSSVRPMASFDLETAYGGEATSKSFNAYYTSSASGYMLMYRRIDPAVRRARPKRSLLFLDSGLKPHAPSRLTAHPNASSATCLFPKWTSCPGSSMKR